MRFDPDNTLGSHGCSHAGSTDVFQSDEQISRTLRSLPMVSPAPDFHTRLQVIASVERQRRMARVSFPARLRLLRDRFDLMCEELVRPLALPLAGGLFSTIILFSMCVVPAYPLRARNAAEGIADVPTVLSTRVALKEAAPFFASGDDVVVDVTVDGQGRMIDYAIVAGAAVLANADLRKRLENALLFTEFTPATSFGKPTSSKMRLWFRSSYIDVKG